MPSKLYSVLKAEKPIFANVPDTSDVAKIIKEYQCGVLASTKDALEMSKQIIALKESDTLDKMSVAASQASEVFDRANEIRKFTEKDRKARTEWALTLI